MTVTADHITKTFGGFRALKDVSLVLKQGETHALLGANGSGKSTFSKVLSGVYQPDGGTIRIGGQTTNGFSSPNHANALGVAVVHQEAPLIDTLSVGECMAMFGHYPCKYGRIDWTNLYAQAGQRLARYSVDIDPRRISGSLAASERALVSLVIALDRVETGIRLLILDEATASLTEKQAEDFLQHVQSVAQPDLAILMVTHRLAELENRVQTVSVLRDGLLVHSGASTATTNSEIIEMMAGPRGTSTFGTAVSRDDIMGYWARARSAVSVIDMSAPPALELRELKATVLDGVNISIRPGEVIGVAGLADSGAQELPQILAGESSYDAGEIHVRGRLLPTFTDPSVTIKAGISVLPADRLRSGGIATLSVSDNLTLPSSDRWWHRSKQKADLASSLIGMLDVRPPDASAIFGTLSGGNQQKVILGKWLSLAPAVLVLDDPTQGVDPNARDLLFAAMHAAAENGVAVILLSTEPDQLAAHCQKVFVLRGGKISTCLEGEDVTREKISEWSYS
ncbi:MULTISPECIES: sugar ABC transporter ATP-binding protein [unclassified Rhizobium]|uniref:sugar ABC transporter ATP-binding protein n=1 Tax=Rhizobium sp. 16-488-2a TaxID=2819990 RepID=UPI001ADB07BA|nr:sugar ABC transporter ATP-binding protein [Rhizobium sp. 16-488-2a]MBO9178283.1 sugar ABC transporter ATP-binding protein [Rhizobium sp. 16-488-2a]